MTEPRRRGPSWYDQKAARFKMLRWWWAYALLVVLVLSLFLLADRLTP